METICKKCVERGEKRWNPTKIKEYQKLFVNLAWFSNIEDEKNNNTLINIAGQLHLIEFIQKLHSDCELSNEDNFYNEETGEMIDADSEIESLLTKQKVCAVGAIVEAICYTILKHKNIDFPKTFTKKGMVDNTNLTVMLNLIEKNKLLSEDEIKLCYEIKDLRNKVHLFDQIKTDNKTFSRDEGDLAMICLYFLLQRWLNASNDTMQIYFSFMPIASKQSLPFDVNKFR